MGMLLEEVLKKLLAIQRTNTSVWSQITGNTPEGTINIVSNY